MAFKLIKSNDEFKQEIEKSKTIVDFYADWCGPCKMLGPIFEMVSNEVADVNFIKVNVDQLPEIAREYNVMSIPTLILFVNGKPTKEKNGFMQKEELKNFIK